MKPGRAIPVIRGRQPEVWEGEYKEFDLYESGRADAIAKDVAGAEATADSWLEIVRQFEPAAKPATDRLLADPELAARIHGRDRKSTRLNSSHIPLSRMPSSA